MRPSGQSLFVASMAAGLWVGAGHPALLGAMGGPSHSSTKIIQAHRVNPQAPKIDGHLDDPAWAQAIPVSDFLQKFPHEGEAPTEKTEVRVLYDEDALYIGVRTFDSEPQKVIGRLTRQDEWSESDWVEIGLDSFHDHQTGFRFAVNPVGVERDAFLFNDTWSDDSWNAVWEGEAAVDSTGWAAEFRIPFSMLRYQAREGEQTWGINVYRRISRKQEDIWWVMVPRSESGVVSRFGHLTGLSGLKPPRRLEILPYFTSRATFSPREPLANPDGRDLFQGLGADLKYGLTSNITLDAAINPDFGQVEADASVLNLSVFETFFPEKRPFFIEGSKFFETPYRLFFSRRVGKRPGRFGLPPGDALIDRPDFTTILAAAKLTGKARGTSFGILEAATAEERARVDSVGLRRERVVEPFTNYSVARVQRDILTGNSTVGLMATAVNRQHDVPAYSSGVDWNLKFKQNTYGTRGQIAMSRAGSASDRETGYAAQVSLSKEGGRWIRGSLFFEAISPEFRINDLGFLRRNNLIGQSNWVQFRTLEPVGPFRQTFNNVNFWQSWNYDGVTTSRGFNFNASFQLKNWWWAGGGYGMDVKTFDDLDTRGAGLIRSPQSSFGWLWLNTDDRKAVVINPNLSWGSSRAGSWWREVGLGVTVKPSSALEFQISPNYSRGFDVAQFIANLDENGDGAIDHTVYGELNTWILDITTRANLTFSKFVSFQFYMQPFVAVGDYVRTKALVRPASFEFADFPLDFNPDFKSLSLNSNAVLRWEFRPGSTLFLVWNQSRNAFSSLARFKPGRDLLDALSADGDQTLLIKLNYWLNL